MSILYIMKQNGVPIKDHRLTLKSQATCSHASSSVVDPDSQETVTTLRTALISLQDPVYF